MAIGNRIKLFRNRNQLTQKQLAELLGLKTITIQSYELNKRTPNIETLNKISQFLNVSPKTLLSDEIFDKEILNKAISLMLPTLPKDADDVFAYLEEYTHDYDSLYNLHNQITNSLPVDCIKGLLNFIFQISREDFKDIYKYLILPGIYELDDEIKCYCEDLYMKSIIPTYSDNEDKEKNIQNKLNKNDINLSELLQPLESLIKFLLEDGYPVSKLDNKTLGYLYEKITNLLEFEFYRLEKNNYKLPDGDNGNRQ
ncbi:helix-turn-helix domain-containing protein [Clostridium sulfidigenes]|uniref:helix-turn-helix domain-containing protein n=1 Tax=Clostridium sulfidigenes TaxID=318464 RepID=UPI00068FCFB1|nr:helix-turn-helix transcriptional regulator [Clostridium sulfidigenes]